MVRVDTRSLESGGRRNNRQHSKEKKMAEFECKRCGTVVEILDCDRPVASQELYCMDCFKIKKQFSVTDIKPKE